MNVSRFFKLYKISIENNRLFILICFCIFTFSILIDSYVSSKELGVYELQIVYNNMSLFRQGVLYIPFCTILTMKLLEFIENNLVVIRLEKKENVWNQIKIHILITNFIISVYLVIFSYISALLFTQEKYMPFSRTLILLISLVLLYTIGLSLFSLIGLTIKFIIGDKVISYMGVLAVLVPEVVNPSQSLILSGISFNLIYFSTLMPAFLNIIKFGVIIIFILGLARILYKKEEVYNTKTLIGGNDYEN